MVQIKHIMKCKYCLELHLAEVHQLTREAPLFMDKSQSTQVLKILLEIFHYSWAEAGVAWEEEDIPAMYYRVYNQTLYVICTIRQASVQPH